MKAVKDKLATMPPPVEFFDQTKDSDCCDTCTDRSEKAQSLSAPQVGVSCYYASKNSRRIARALYGKVPGRTIGKWPSGVEETAILDYLRLRENGGVADEGLDRREGKIIFETAVAETTKDFINFVRGSMVVKRPPTAPSTTSVRVPQALF